jgi:glycosyltransferase involved in cell wall biosynthesis
MTTGLSPLVSIVTPVYNEVKCLAECIESVLAQTYQHWDYTIVDNCSTDGSIEIARQYAARDSRIRVVHNQKFVRATENFNLALRQISPASKYCKIVLGDDWIFPECVERMVALAEEHPSVAIVSAYALAGHEVKWTGLPYPSTCISGREVCRRTLLEDLRVFGSENSVLYRADLVRDRNPFYNEATLHADTEVCFELLKTYDFGFVHQVLTFTRVRPGSLSNIAADLHTDFGGILQTIVRHGADYLTRNELDKCLDSFLSAYYRFLGKSLLFNRDKAFWDYHKRMLAEAGAGFSHARLGKTILTAICEAVLNPKNTVERSWRVWREIVTRRRSVQHEKSA